MSGSTTNVPSPTFGANGFVAPLESAILAGVQADQVAAFGSNLNLALTEPQGQLATSLTAIIADCYSQFLALAANFDPKTAQGIYQNALAQIYFLTRNSSSSTILQIACGGLQGVYIPVGAQVYDPNGNIYACTTAGYIPATGSITLPFQNQISGPLVVPATVTLYQLISNLNTVSVVSGTLGALQESTAAFEARREQTVVANSVGMVQSIQGALLKVPGVVSAFTVDNSTSGSVTVNGVTLPAYSLFTSVYLSAQTSAQYLAVATAIWNKKMPGCVYYTGTGSQSAYVQDPNISYNGAGPIYTVYFYNITTPNLMFFNVYLKNTTQIPANAQTLIAGAMLNAFSGADGGIPAFINSEVYTSRFYAGIAALGPWAQIISMGVSAQAGTADTQPGTITASISGTTMTVTAVGAVALAVGQFIYVSSGAVASGTYIVSQLTGTTGSTGTYQVSVSQTLTSSSLLNYSCTLSAAKPSIVSYPAFGGVAVILQ